MCSSRDLDLEKEEIKCVYLHNNFKIFQVTFALKRFFRS